MLVIIYIRCVTEYIAHKLIFCLKPLRHINSVNRLNSLGSLCGIGRLNGSVGAESLSEKSFEKVTHSAYR